MSAPRKSGAEAKPEAKPNVGPKPKAKPKKVRQPPRRPVAVTPSSATRIHRWAAAPAELRALFGDAARDSIAQIPATKRSEPYVAASFGWHEVQQVELEDGTLLIAGNRKATNG